MPVWTFTLSGDPKAKLMQVRRAAAKQHIGMKGNTRRGNFTGAISGSYRVTGNQITVSITSKPFFVSWEYVYEQLRQFLEG